MGASKLANRPKPQSTAYRYGFAVVAAAAMIGAAAVLNEFIQHNPVLFGITAVMVVAWHVGFGPGVVAALTVILVSRPLFLKNAPMWLTGPEILRFLLFLSLTSLIAALSSARKKAEDALIRANQDLDQRVEEKTAELRAANQALTKQVAETREAQAELQRANRMKDQFLAMLGHELRNPLAAINSGVMVLQMDPPPDRRERVHETLATQVRHLSRITDDLLDSARISQGKLDIHPEMIPLAEVVQTAVDLSLPLIEQSQHELKVDLPERPVNLYVDVQRMAQVLSNLLSNAAKYTPAGGLITLSAGQSDGGVWFRVRDTGVGIPKDKQPIIFNLFAQLDQPAKSGSSGLGLGLAISRALVELHGGSIEASSDGEGMGAEFRIWIPDRVPGESRAPQEIEAASNDRGANKRRLLVVDDDQDASEMLKLLLEMRGFEVHAAHGGGAALNLLRELRPDAVLMDLSMPGIDGWEAARRIRCEPWGKDLRLVALSGWAQEQDRARSKEAGFDLHWVKPLRPADLEALFAEQPAARP